jgi:hypothetical protein
MVDAIIRYLLSNFTLTFLAVGFIASAIALMRARKPLSAPVVVEATFRYFLLFSVGIGFLYNFVMHTVFGDVAAAFIGWPDSPFQAEVGYASLGMALVGFLAWRGSFDMRVAAVVAPAAFLWGAAFGHVQQMRVAGNFAPGNAGVVFYTDLAIPLLGLFLLWRQRIHGRAADVAHAMVETPDGTET